MQQGDNRLPRFLDGDYRIRYLYMLHIALHSSDFQLHAYALMDNYLHLLAAPLESVRLEI
ncbi:hypothetical protein [uncultured Xanthomonas sp.]|uniref:hypothetical protein n=1 Tax=uncultured Xanthomonas sp. TaxID=152831 RepID=UPI0025D3E068|nr:hypothetical protein [uncultured Xanthomonas sp.]